MKFAVNSKKTWWVIGGLAVAILTIILWAGLSKSGYFLDRNAKDGAAVIEGLQKNVDANQFRFQMAPYLYLKSTENTTSGMIVNHQNNPFKTRVELTLDGSGEIIYTSGVLVPGERIQEISFPRVFEPGEHLGVARFIILDQETEMDLGEVKSEFVIKVSE
ncbi:MAG: hypothetical protein ACRCU3_03670 [Eubacteriaceae bacterium]